MDSPIDKVETIPTYQAQDKIAPVDRSKRDRERKFADELKAKMEKEKKKDKGNSQDEVLLSEDNDSSSDDGATDREAADHPESPNRENQSSEHVDIKA
jgi:hypothetical protein